MAPMDPGTNRVDEAWFRGRLERDGHPRGGRRPPFGLGARFFVHPALAGTDALGGAGGKPRPHVREPGRRMAMAERLKDKVAIVTGAGAIGPGWGNGKAAAVLFAREGARVFAVDINPAAAEETKAIIAGEGGACTAHPADVSRSGEVEAMVNRCFEVYGRIDVLHNNVGICEVGGIAEASEESWDRVIAVNLKSVYLTCRHTLPHMVGAAGAPSSTSPPPPPSATWGSPTTPTASRRRESGRSPRTSRSNTPGKTSGAMTSSPG